MILLIILLLIVVSIFAVVLFMSGPGIIEGFMRVIEEYRDVFHSIRERRNQE